MSAVSQISVGSDGVAVDSQNNANAVATLAAAGIGAKWRITGICATYSGTSPAAPVRATLLVNGVTMGFGVSTSSQWMLTDLGLDGADNGAVVLTLPAGGAGAVGDVILMATKIPTNGLV